MLIFQIFYLSRTAKKNVQAGRQLTIAAANVAEV